MSLIENKNLLIIDGKDYQQDNYNLEKGLFLLDLVAVSTVCPSAALDPNLFTYDRTFYIGLSSGYRLKWEWPTYYAPSAIFKGNTYTNGCITYTSGTTGIPNTEYYGSSSNLLSTVFVDFSSNPTANIITNVRRLGYVSPCLEIPVSADYDENGVLSATRTFLDYTLSGGIEAIRFFVTNFPKFEISAYALDLSNTVIASAIWQQEFYEVSANIVNTNNKVDQWYIDTSGFMYPDKTLPSDWKVRWDLQNNTGFVCATYLGSSVQYPVNTNKLSGQPFTIVQNPYVDGIRFYFNEPGSKLINFYAISSTPSYTQYNYQPTIGPINTGVNKTDVVSIADIITYNNSSIRRVDNTTYAQITSNPSNYYISWKILAQDAINTDINPLTSVSNISNTYSQTFEDTLLEKNTTITSVTQLSTITISFSSNDVSYSLTPNIYIFDQTAETILATESLQTDYLHSTSLYLKLSSYDISNPNTTKITLNLLTLYSNNNKTHELDNSLPDTKWTWTGNLTGRNVKSNNLITNPQIYAEPVGGDTIEFSFSDSGYYNISASFTDNTSIATYDIFNFKATQIKLLSSYNDCNIIPYVSLSAAVDLNGTDYLIKGNNIFGNAIQLKWFGDSDNIKIYNDSNDLLLSNQNYNSIYANPVKAYLDYPRDENVNINTSNISVYSDFIIGDNKTTSISIQSKTAPLGLDLDFNINYEKASELPDGFYRFINTSNYNLQLLGLIKPSTNWYTNQQLLDIPDSSTKCYYYFNNETTSKKFGVNLLTSLNINTNYTLSSVTFGISCLNIPELNRNVSIEKSLNLRFYKTSALPNLSAFLYPEFVWNLPSLTNPVCSLAIDPNAYWTYNPYPSAYGEGNTVTFFGSAYGVGGSIAYNDFTWHIIDEGVKSIAIDDNLNKSITTTQNTTKDVYVTVAAFNNLIGLQNQTLSTYKDDTNGAVKTFPNWKSLSATPIKITTYEQPSSKSIITSKEYVENTNYINLEVNLNFPNNSPVSLNKNEMSVYWTVTSDTGKDFSTIINGNNPFRLEINQDSEISTIYFNASVNAPIHIPNYSPYFFNYPNKFIEVNIPNVYPAVSSLDVAFINFKIESNTDNTIFDNNTRTITALRAASISGVIKTSLPITSSTWTVSTNNYINSSWLSSFQVNPPFPYRASDYTDIILPVTLSLTSNSTVYTRTKNVLITTPPAPNIEIYPDNTTVGLYEDLKFLNITTSVIPLSVILYQFENETTVNKLNQNDNFTHAFSSTGDINLYISAIDTKGFLHEQEVKNIVNVTDQWQDYNEFIKTGFYEELLLPYNFEDIKLAPNEWVVSNTINKSLENLYYDVIYLNGICNFYSSAPYKYLGWYGNTETGEKWNLYPYNSTYTTVQSSVNYPSLSGIVAYSESTNYICLAFKNKIQLRTNKINSTLIAEITKRGIDDDFVDIRNVFIDENDKIIVLDRISEARCIISVFIYDSIYTFNPIRQILKWGGLGDSESKLKFRNANDMTLNYDNNITVADTGNRSIKRYTTTGSWLSTITSDKFNPNGTTDFGTIENGSLISAFYARNKYTYSLTQNEVIIFDENDEFLSSFNWRQPLDEDKKNLTPVRIIAAYDNNIVYVLCEEYLIKYTIDGVYLGLIGETPQEYNTVVGNFKYVNATHNKNRVLILASDRFILKYSDFITYFKIKPTINNLWWCFNDIKIKDGEFVEYWVYNRAFARLWDNLEFFRTTLSGRVIATTTKSGKTIFKYYNRLEYARPNFKYQKEDIFIGMNEFVTSEVVNRCLQKLFYTCIELLNMITSKETIWRWVDTIQTGKNPVTYSQTKESGKKPTRWTEAVG